MPHEKPPKWALTFAQWLYHHLSSPLRVIVELAPSSIKRLRMVADALRLLRGEWRHATVARACGLSAQLTPRLPRCKCRKTLSSIQASFSMSARLWPRNQAILRSTPIVFSKFMLISGW